MRAGQLRDRVTIQSLTTASDGQGGSDETPATVIANVPAQVLPISNASGSGSEGIRAGAMTSELTTLVRLRYRDDISPKHRVIFGSRTLRIVSVQDPDGRRSETQLLCTEVEA